MRKLLIWILVSLTLVRWSSFAETTTLSEAYKNQKSNVQVKRTVNIIRILNDDNRGSRHQKFILK